jgi:hypothetical protein
MKILLKICKDNPKEITKVERRIKKNRMHNEILQLICFCSLGFQKEVH